MIEKPKNINPELYFSSVLLIAKGNDLIESLIISKNEIIALIKMIEKKIILSLVLNQESVRFC